MLVAILLLLVYSGISAADDIEEYVKFAPNLMETKKDLDNSMKASNLIDLYTLFILQQITFPQIPGVPYLPYNQQQTKATAMSWRSVVRPALYQANDAVIVFGDYFNNFYDTLISNAPDITSNEQARELFVLVLEELKYEISRQKNLTTDAATKLRTFYNSMANHSADLQKDVIMLDNSTRINTAEATYLKDRMKSLDAQIQHFENDIKRTTETVTHTIFFIIPISSEQSRDLSGSLRRLNELLDERYRVYMRMAAIDSSFSFASVIKMEVVNLISYVRNVLNATEALGRAWTQLENQYTVVCEKFSSIPVASPRQNISARNAGILLRNKLRTAREEWISLYNYASEIKRSLLAPPILRVVEQMSIQ